MHVDRKALQMTEEELATYIADNRYARLGTVNARCEPHVTPIGYVDWNGSVYFLSLRRSRRGRDLEVNARVSLCIDDGVGDNDPYTVRRGAVLYGRCTPADDDEATMDQVRAAFIERQRLSPEEIRRTTHDWYRIEIDRSASWDFRKIPPGADFKADRVHAATAASNVPEGGQP